MSELPATMVLDGPALSDAATALPDRRGVIVLEGDEGRALLAATTASARAFAETRLAGGSDPAPESDTGPRADLRAITRRVLFTPTGSALESDLLYRDVIAERFPTAYATAQRRWHTWWISIDHGARTPVWKSVGSDELPKTPESTRVFLGPFGTSETAGQAISSLIDLFDLCREERLLAQAPSARACVYKEMGRCPAPCDGTESMPAFQSRVADACEMVISRGTGGWRQRVERTRQECVTRHDFERAGAIQQRLRHAEALLSGPFRFVSSPTAFDWLFAMRGASASRTRVLRASTSGIRPIGDFTPRRLDALRQRLAEEIPGMPPVGAPCADVLGILLRYLKRSQESSGGVRAMRLIDGRVADEESLQLLLAPPKERAKTSEDDEQEQATTHAP